MGMRLLSYLHTRHFLNSDRLLHTHSRGKSTFPYWTTTAAVTATTMNVPIPLPPPAV